MVSSYRLGVACGKATRSCRYVFPGPLLVIDLGNTSR